MDYDKELRDFRKKMLSFDEDNLKGMPELEEWSDEFEDKLAKVSKECIKKYPSEKGFVEAYFLVFARFICRLMYKMQRDGMVEKGVDAFDFFTKVLMPICKDLVVAEMKDEDDLCKIADSLDIDHEQAIVAKEIFKALAGDKMTIEEIVDKYVESDDREAFIKRLTEMRAEIREMQGR